MYGLMLTERQKRNFHAKVERRGPDECWPWKGHCRDDGYGAVSLCWKGRISIQLAHRIAFFLRSGELVVSLNAIIQNTCGNRACCNPAHLVDRQPGEEVLVAKQKMRSGELPPSPHCKLTNEQIDEIRRERRAGATVQALGDKYGVTRQTITSVTTRHTAGSRLTVDQCDKLTLAEAGERGRATIKERCKSGILLKELTHDRAPTA